MSKRKFNKHTNYHHRICRSNGGALFTPSGKLNIIEVNAKRHRLFHRLFNNMTPEQIARYLSEVWLDPDIKLVVVPNTGD